MRLGTPAPGSGRILVMDDDDIVRRSIVRMLRRSGYDTEEVTDGEQALARYEAAMDTSNAFKAVIMDLTIPGGMGGKETVARLRTLHPEARVIASSGYSHDPVMADFTHYGFDEAVRKPISRDHLIETLQAVLAAK